ncbi:prepilin-type N-terminal cleavage/methylation domain-containing protein [Candidatus Woesebacteria bacterium]|nr:prepilin-type N-terminal cleavage/methylation domain-containing protein [Candidatus Woesebacteria bacterium]
MANRVKKRLLLKAGVTLTELLIVVAIIAFLAILAFWAYRTQVYKGYDARRKTDIYQIKVAVEEYEKDNDCYPLPELVVCDPGTGLRPYLDKIPCDPRTKASYYYDHEDSACPRWFRLYSVLDNVSDCVDEIGPNGDYCYYSGSANAPDPGFQGDSSFYGCKSGVCVPIQWDPNRPGPECDPNYQSPSCYGQCGAPGTECQPWQ